jgi:two-component system chemotaxis response regulator CheB
MGGSETVQSTTSPIRVMVVDDSAVARWMIQTVLEVEPDMTVAGTAGNGAQALERLETVRPDLIVLDVEMPVMDGIQTLKRLRRTHPELPVVMFSTLTAKSAAVTLEALALGASDYVYKPHGEGSREAAIAAVRTQLVPRIRALGRHSSFSASPGNQPLGDDLEPPRPATRRLWPTRIEAVLMAASTGGPNALAEVIENLPGSVAAPVLVVQHMPPVFTQMLADRLDSRSQLRVVESSPGKRVRPGTVYIAQGGTHLVVRRSGTEVLLDADDGPSVHSVKPSADVLFKSAVEVWGGNLLSVVMTGMGEDGLDGCRAVAAAGGMVVAQDRESSLVWGMPGAVARAGLASEIVPLDQIAGIVARHTHSAPEGALT